jgi:hypothetical protein
MTEGLLESTDNPSPQGGENGTDIFASVPREVRFSADGNDKLARFSDPSSLAKSYLELEKLSSGKAKMLTDDATEEEVSAFYQKLPSKFRAPDTVEGYGQLEGETYTEDDKAYFGAIANAAYSSKIPASALQGIIQAHNEYTEAKIAVDTNTTEEALQKEWVGDYKQNIEIIERVFRELPEGGDEFKQWFNSVGGGRSQVALKALLTIGKATLDDSFVEGDKPKPEVDEFVPKYPNSPEQYRNDPTEDGEKARAWFRKNKGYEY